MGINEKANEARGIEITPAMVEAGFEFAYATLRDYPIADLSIRLLVEGILERALTARMVDLVDRR